MMWRLLRIFLLIVFNLFCEVIACSAACGTSGTTLNAASASATDVQACFNIVSSTTSQVNIPAGTPTWTTQVTLTVPSGNTSLAVVGAGAASTVITENYASGNSLLVLNTNSSPTGLLRVSGLQIVGTNANVKFSGLIQLASGSEQFRLDHVTLDTSGVSQEAGMRITGCTYGVADHDTFTAAIGQVNNGIQQYNQGSCYSDAVGVGDQAWAHATNFGSSKAFYVENSTFNNGFGNDCTLGGSYVMRFNTINASGGNETFQTHPTGGATRWRGCRQWEIYKNTWVFNQVTPTFMNGCMFISSGTGLTWGNTIPSSSANGGTGCKQLLAVEAVLPNNVAYTQTATPSGWGYCGTTSGLTGQGSAWNGSTTGSGYPCLDQPGRGQSDLLVGGFVSDGSGSDNVCDQTVHGTGANCGGFGFNGNWPNQALEPLYEWLDSYSAIPSNTTNVFTANTATGTTFNDNADIYHWCSTSVDSGLANGCTTAFDGTKGVGNGTRAARPATCTKGVAYWSTDQGTWNNGASNSGVLDMCTATNTWTNNWYVPYTYPHPLVSGTTGVSPLLLVAKQFLNGVPVTW